MGENRCVTPRVSVIIPVYNTEQYLEEAVGSIAGQTLRDIEIIAVDDGSRDGSLALLQRMAEADSRIRVFSQPNGGAAVARNTGLEHATGQFVHFMDSDDVLEADALALCVDKCEAEGLDFVLFDAVVMNEIPGYTFNYRRGHKIEDRIYKGIDLLDTLLAVDGYTVQPSLNVIRRSYLESIGLRFYPVMHEDELFSALLFLPAQRVGVIDRAFFHRRVRPDSIMTSAFTRRRIDSYLAMVGQLERYKNGKDEATRQMVRRLMSRILDGLMHNAAAMPRRVRMQLLRESLTKYRGLAGRKSIAVLIAPWTIRLKSKFKKR